jgi:hypothetical protein
VRGSSFVGRIMVTNRKYVNLFWKRSISFCAFRRLFHPDGVRVWSGYMI